MVRGQDEGKPSPDFGDHCFLESTGATRTISKRLSFVKHLRTKWARAHRATPRWGCRSPRQRRRRVRRSTRPKARAAVRAAPPPTMSWTAPTRARVDRGRSRTRERALRWRDGDATAAGKPPWARSVS
jgi:hypothetical protein